MKGFLSKKGQNNFFTRYYKRYIEIDFAAALFKIRHGPDRNDKEEIVAFRDIDYIEVKNDNFKAMDKNSVLPFNLCINGKSILFYAATENERNIWIAGFNYAVASTELVQKILKDEPKKRRCTSNPEKEYKKPAISIELTFTLVLYRPTLLNDSALPLGGIRMRPLTGASW